MTRPVWNSSSSEVKSWAAMASPTAAPPVRASRRPVTTSWASSRVTGIRPVSTRLMCPMPEATTAGEKPNTSAPRPAAGTLPVNRRSSGNAHSGPAARPRINITLYAASGPASNVTGVMIRAGNSRDVFHIPLTPTGAFIVVKNSGSCPCSTAQESCWRYQVNSRMSAGFPATIRFPGPPSRCQVR
jgi:hypothetical protein